MVSVQLEETRRKLRKCSCVPRKRGVCRQVFTFLLVVLVVVPLVVFGLSSIFALLLWAVECAELTEAEAGSGVLRSLDGYEYDACTYYEWFKYVMGNLVGVSLTAVDEGMSGHVFSEIVDLLVSTWSLALTGSVVGLIGGMSIMNVMVEKLDGPGDEAVEAVARHASAQAHTIEGLDFAAFDHLVRRNELNLTKEQTASIFRIADSNRNGALEEDECTKLVDLLRVALPRKEVIDLAA